MTPQQKTENRHAWLRFTLGGIIIVTTLVSLAVRADRTETLAASNQKSILGLDVKVREFEGFIRESTVNQKWLMDSMNRIEGRLGTK